MKILVVSNMYPDNLNPSYGVFVKRFCNQLELIGILYDKSVMHKGNSKIQKLIGYIKFYVCTTIKIIFKKYDLIYVHYASHSSIPVLIASKFKKIKVFTNVHGSDIVPKNNKQQIMQKFTRKILKVSDKVIVPSDYFKRYVCEKYNLNSSIIEVYPSSGVNKDLFYIYNNNQRDAIKRKYNIAKDEIVVGFVGRIIEGKGWDTFIKGLNYFYEMHQSNNIKVILVGSGVEEEKLNKLIQNTCLNNRIIRFQLLHEKELANIYNILTLFVFSTELKESLGLVALEAMACGVPVIASDFAAQKYYVKDGYNGYKFEVNNSVQLSECIEKYLMLDEKNREQMSRNAYNTAKDFFEDNIINKLELIIKK